MSSSLSWVNKPSRVFNAWFDVAESFLISSVVLPGAAWIVWPGGRGLATSLLASRPLVAVGLISYSLYLWHWPVAVISRYVAIWYGCDPDLKAHKLAVLALSFAAAILSWYFVERPFRQRPYRLGSTAILSASGATMAFLIATAAAVYPLSERFWQMPQSAERVLTALNYRSPNAKRSCFLTPKNDHFRHFNQAGCLRMSDTKENWLLIGDSHADDLWAGLAGVNPQINLMQGTASGCKPLLDLKGERRCTDLMHFLFADFIPKHRFDVILLSARWGSGNIADLRKTTNALMPYAERVVVIGPHVEYRLDLPWLLAASMLKHDPAVVDRARLAKQRQTDRLFAEQLRRDGVGYVSLHAALCPGGRCRVTDDEGLPLAFDYGHLTTSGSIIVAQRIKRSGDL